MQGNKEAACRIFDEAVTAAADKGLDGEKAHTFLVVSYAHFLVQQYKDVDAARSLYAAALQRAPSSVALWEGAIHLEESIDAPVQPDNPVLCKNTPLFAAYLDATNSVRSGFGGLSYVHVRYSECNSADAG